MVLTGVFSPSLLGNDAVSPCVLRFVRVALAPLAPRRVSSPSLFSSLPRRFYSTSLCARRLRRVLSMELNPPPRLFLLNSPRYLLRRLQLSTRRLSTRTQTTPKAKKKKKRIRKSPPQRHPRRARQTFAPKFVPKPSSRPPRDVDSKTSRTRSIPVATSPTRTSRALASETPRGGLSVLLVLLLLLLTTNILISSPSLAERPRNSRSLGNLKRRSNIPLLLRRRFHRGRFRFRLPPLERKKKPVASSRNLISRAFSARSKEAESYRAASPESLSSPRCRRFRIASLLSTAR